ncbi:MAG: DNA polymerase III subunit alpha, partial [Phycisphaerae bacterium]|nr:DNA polymerase III subunit alpha [Phycisphaerae bacterium]
QVMQIVHRLGGISLGRALSLVKAISKKKNSIIRKEREPFMAGALASGLDKGKAEQIFELILRFGGYGFNKAHSTRYAVVAYQTAYFKRHYPLEFMSALLTFEMGNTDKIVGYIEECRQMGIEVLPPDINESEVDFTTSSGTIRFGLAAVKGVGEKAVEEIIAARDRTGGFRSLFHFCESVDLRVVNRAVIEALIKCGAFDSTGALRAPLMKVVGQTIEQGASAAEDRRRGQGNLFGGSEGEDPEDDYANLPDVSWSESEMLAYEKATLGFYVTSHPLVAYSEQLRGLSTAGSQTLKGLADGAEVIVGGMLSRVHYRVTHNARQSGAKMALLTIEDLDGPMDAVIFPDELAKHTELIHAERMVFVLGQVSLRREVPSVRVMEVYPIERGMELLARSVVVHLANKPQGEELLPAVQKIVQEYPGQCPLYFVVDTGQGYTVAIQASEQMQVQPSAAFCERMRALLGSGQVQIIGPNGPVGKAVQDNGSETLEEAEEVLAQNEG